MKWLYGIVGLGLIVFIHEAGHFIAAKLCGVEVESFSLGYGPKVLHKVIHNTDYRLSLFPLGGYCGLKGESDFREAMDEGWDAVRKTRGSLYAVHPLLRAVIGVAGPLFNMLFAVASLSVVAMVGYSYKSYSPRIRLANEVFADVHSAAKDAGVLTGDIIKEINGVKIESFADIVQEVATHANEVIAVTVDRNGDEATFQVHTELDKTQGIGKIGVTVFCNELVSFEAEKLPPSRALVEGAREAFGMAELTIKAIGMLFCGVDIRTAVSGPARITDMLGTAAKDGFSEGAKEGLASVLDLMAVISVSLFVMNLLPVPILDGGLVLFSLIEFCTMREIKPRVQYRAQIAGLVLVALLLAVGISSDVAYFVGQHGISR